MKELQMAESEVIFTDYPVGKFARKVDWWLSDHGLEVIAGWRQSGYTIQDIRERMGVDPRTFRAWRKKSDKLDDILTVGKEITNARVANALYQRAVGYNYEEITKELVEGEMRVTKIVTKHVPPDVKACLSWLFNRQSNLWRAIQPPLDIDSPSVLAADSMLVTIREAAESIAPVPMDNGEQSTTQAKEDTTESTGEVYGS